MTNLLITILMLALPAQASETYDDVIGIIDRVNTHWQQTHQPEVRAFWDDAAYFTGNMEVYKLTGRKVYLDYSRRWCEFNHWMGATEPDASKWQYKQYGEDMQHVLFADWQICFQTYLDMYALNPQPVMVKRVKEVIDHVCAMPDNDFWWWADALYMAMPIYTKMYKMTADLKYLNKLYVNYQFADQLMYDKDSRLYFRDGKYIYPKHTTRDGKKDFWARGNGWVLAGLAKVLQDMPTNYEHRDFFVTRYRQLAEGVAASQQPEGYWTRSMVDAMQAEGPETSGTAFFTYGLYWGINHGYLSRTKYAKVADKAWRYLEDKALQTDGTVGYVQPIGEKAIPGQQLTSSSTSNFGVGAFLLASCERAKYLLVNKHAGK
jgi:unsaturated rhamnogalacturonyl hydrolase